MSFRPTVKRLSVPLGEGTLRTFVTLLQRCGVAEENLPKNCSELTSSARFQAFHPLFTPHFTFQQQQLTMYGDAVIDDYLSRVMLDYSAHMGLVVSVNTAKLLCAVFHNHYSLRLLAKEYGFEQLAIPTTGPFLSEDAKVTSQSLDFLESQRLGIRSRDTAATSFQITPLASAHSPLGWKMSHFIGAMQHAYGSEIAFGALERLYDLENSGNIPERASALLLRVLEVFHAANVAEALLAAQGISTRFKGRTRILPGEEGATPRSSSSTKTEASDGHAAENEANAGSASDMLMISGFGQKNSELDSLTLDNLSGSFDLRASLAAGPGAVDSFARWHERTAALVESNLEPSPSATIDEGWLTAEETKRSKWGPAHSRSVDFSLYTSYADEYGLQHPEDGKRVARNKFRKPVRDPLFYDKMSDMRNGVPFSTNGEPLADFLDRFSAPHHRLFEVSMVTESEPSRVVGRAIASKYTVARESACRAYLGAVLNDLSLISSKKDTASDDNASQQF